MPASGSDNPRVPPPPMLRKPPPLASQIASQPSHTRTPAPPPPASPELASDPEIDIDIDDAAEAIGPHAFVPPDGDAEEVDMSAGELDVLFAGDAEEATPEPAPKPKYALPRPKPVKSKAADFQNSSRRSTPPPLSGNVPKGIRPPSSLSSEVIQPEDTDVIIAALGAAMIDEEPAAGESVEAQSPAVASGSGVARLPARPASAETSGRRFAAEGSGVMDDDDLPISKPTPWLWITGGALAAVVIGIVALSWGDDDGASQKPEPSAASYSAAMSADSAKEGGLAKAGTPPRREAPGAAEAAPAIEPLPTDDHADADAGEPGDELVVAEEAEADAAAVEVAAPDPPPPAPAAEAAAIGPTPASTGGGHGKRRHKSRHANKTVSSSSPTPASAPAQAPAPKNNDSNADDLLAQAKRALASGQNSAAYSYAAQSRRLKKSTTALQIMARAGCRLGSENKAKAAFSQLPIGLKSGIRSECRAKGIRLGL